MNTIYIPFPTPAQVDTRVNVFEEIFLVFLGLGTLVGVVVIAYMLYNAYKYRDDGDHDDADDLPALGELPTGSGGGKKLFVSFFLSAIVVISLIVWTYGMLLYVEDPEPSVDLDDAIEVDVEAFTFGFSYEYDNGIESGTLVVPEDRPVRLSVTSIDVWHTFGLPQERVKADAIPGEVDETWFQAESEPGEYSRAIECFELCGPGHTNMKDDYRVVEDYDAWVDEQLTLHLTVQDGNETPITEGYELELEYAEDPSQFSESYTADEFENGTITITEIEQGGEYNVTVTPDEGSPYEPYEDTIDHTGADGGVEETITLESPEAEDEENGTDESGGDDS